MKKLKLLFLDTSLFRLSYILALFFSMVMYVDMVAYVIVYILFLWGFALTLYKIIKEKIYTRMYIVVWLLAFLLSFSLTVLVNINLNILSLAYNLLMLAHSGLCFFIFFGMHSERGSLFRWELYLMARVIVYLSTIFTFIGLVLMLFTQGKFDDYMYYENVFKGFFTNPNYQGYVSALSVIFCHMLTKPDFIANSGQKRVSRLWIVSCIFLNCTALLLCDSNGSLLFIVSYVASIVLLKLFAMIDNLTPKKIVIRVIVLIVAGIVAVAIMMFVRVICRIGVAAFFSETGLTQAQIDALTSDVIFIPSKDAGFTSRWFLWDAGFKLWTQNPVFGIGKGNLYDGIVAITGRENLNSQYDGIIQIGVTDLHNGYLTILTTAGVIGFIIFAVFLVRYLMIILPVWYVHRRIMTYSAFPCLISFIFAYFIFSVIEKTIIFDNTYMVMSFWLILGYTICYAISSGYQRRGAFYIGNFKLDKKYI